MKNVWTIAATMVAVTAAVLFMFREPLVEAATDRITADMFVAGDEDDFEPGLAVGERLPEIAAVYDGRMITSVEPFMGPNGLVLFANRSVDW